MATYAELSALVSDNEGVRAKVVVAAVIKAKASLDEASPSADRLAYASSALMNPGSVADELFHYVLAANSTATVSQIIGAADTLIQSNVDTAVDDLHP